MSESTTSVETDNTDNTDKPDNTVELVKPDNTVEPASSSPSNINWTPIDMPPRISAVGSGESQDPTSNSTSDSTSDDTAPNQGDDTSTVKSQSVPNKLPIGYMSLYPLLCVVMNLAFVVMMMLDIRAFQRYNALCVGVWVFTIISVVYALAIGWIAINDDIKTRRNNTTDKNDKQINNPVETNADRHTADTATQNDTIIPVSDTVRVETVEKTIEEAVVDNTDNVYVDNNNQPSNDKYPKGASKYDEPLIVDADNLAFDKTLDTKQVLHPANKTPFEPVEPTEDAADNLSFPQKDTPDTPDPKIMKMPHVPAVPAVIIKKHDEPMTQHVPNTASVQDDNNATGDTNDTDDDNNKHDDDTKANQSQSASTDASDNTDDATMDAHSDADADVIKRVESDPNVIAVEQQIINQTEPPEGRSREEIKDELAAKDADPASHDENDDADDSDKQTPSVPDGPTYTFDVD